MAELEGQEPGRVSRRRLIGGAAVGAAALAAPEAAEARTRRHRSSRRRDADVAVVGAGLAGLTAARELRKAGKSVIVVEARNRVGGRCRSRSIGPGAPDVANMGATFVGPTQTKIIALAHEMGKGIFPTYNTGKNVLYFNGHRATYSGAVPPADPTALIEAQVAITRLDQMAKEVPLHAPWLAPQALRWDGQTVETWKLENILTPTGRKLIDLGVEAILSVEPRDVSLLYLLFYIHSAGSLEELINTAGGAQESRIEGGTQGVSIELARRLGKGRVYLRAPAEKIVDRGRRIEVHTPRVTVRAKRVIVTVPPALAGRIVYDPPLPAQRDQMTQRMPFGSVVKTVAVYDRPFWRDEGLTGQATSDQGPVKVTFDCSPRTGRPGVLMGFVDAEDARRLTRKSDAQRKAESLESLRLYFGDKALRPKLYFDATWDKDPWERGCPVCICPPGALTSYGEALKTPLGRIHWAGTETAEHWSGYMDGAVESGQRVAREVLASL